jgi:hypothetical protein
MSVSFSFLAKTLPAFLPLILACHIQAQIREPREPISDFKLITLSAGYVVSGDRLFWTNSAGSDWSNITPSASAG